MSHLPSVHQMVVTLEANGLIERVPGQGRSVRLLVRERGCRTWSSDANENARHLDAIPPLVRARVVQLFSQRRRCPSPGAADPDIMLSSGCSEIGTGSSNSPQSSALKHSLWMPAKSARAGTMPPD